MKAVKGGSPQTIPTATNPNTVVTFVDDFDPQNWWTPSKFQPTIAGYYNIQIAVWWDPASTTVGQNNIQLRQNGSAQIAIQQSPLITTTGYGQEIDIIAYFNGTNDYVELTAYTDNTTSQNINSASSGTWFTAALIVGSGANGTSGTSGSGSGGGGGTSGTSGTSPQGVTSGTSGGGSGTGGSVNLGLIIAIQMGYQNLF
jgi:hypothetical protein